MIQLSVADRREPQRLARARKRQRTMKTEKQSKPTVSVIIPTYNDIEQLPGIVAALQQSKYVLEIIVVDDGSTLSNKSELKKIAKISLILNEENKGKARVMEQGFLASTGDVIFYIDADLHNFDTYAADALIKPVVEDGYDMAISKRGGGPEKYWNHIGGGIAVTGERVLKRELIEENMEIFAAKGFAIESEMNKVMFGKYKICMVYLPRLANELKISKHGFMAIKGDIKCWIEIFSNISPQEFIRQCIIAKNLEEINPETARSNSLFLIYENGAHKLKEKLISLKDILKS
jgi:glycosyltransferase involved in cell wall biosynthesis